MEACERRVTLLTVAELLESRRQLRGHLPLPIELIRLLSHRPLDLIGCSQLLALPLELRHIAQAFKVCDQCYVSTVSFVRVSRRFGAARLSYGVLPQTFEQ